MTVIYNEYSIYLKERYHCKVYKLPVNLPLTCPNRDGNLSFGGCTYCGEIGTGFEMHPCSMNVSEQLIKNMSYIRKKYKAKKFIAYFQNFSNTYLELGVFKRYIQEAIMDDIVGISISTRPDSLNEDYLRFLSELGKENNLDIIIELGLQTANYKTLKRINRGHTLAEFIDAVLMIKRYELDVCAHVILNLPGDDIEDTVETAKILSAMGMDFIKVHSLYILKNTQMGDEYLKGSFELITKEEYLLRLETFLSYLSPDIVIQRLFGRAPEKDTLFSNWETSWWKLRDEFVASMNRKNLYQGIYFDYLGGKALKNMNKTN
ncbi:MAG: Uncharacterized protein XD91_0862 [Clostridiales bacterium 38_11]|nr:MAG: Uncharacterized protein XD91_0862 [Clostridiales bacterium 38_11]HBH11759.1 TIGR01212 family radical SAM protein [Clostridiales bacterium]